MSLQTLKDKFDALKGDATTGTIAEQRYLMDQINPEAISSATADKLEALETWVDSLTGITLTGADLS